MSDTWFPGEVAVIDLQIDDRDGQPADPGSLVLRVRRPDGVVEEHALGGAVIVRTAAGRYEVEVPLSSAGIWAWRWEGSGLHAGAAEGQVAVRKSRLT